MRRKFFVFTGLCAVLAMTALVGGGPEDGADPTEGASYIGAKNCKKCHMKQHRSWKKMKHAKAWENLPEDARDGTKKDEMTGRACVECHTTGYGQKDRGGFMDAGSSADLVGVGCEACHGPGSKHIEAGKKVKDEKRKFNEGEKKYIQRKSTNCTSCHNPHNNYAKKYGK